MSSSAKQTVELIKAIWQQLHPLTTFRYKLLRVNHFASLLPISRKEVHFLSRGSSSAASSGTLHIQSLVSLLSLQPLPVTQLFSLRIQLCFPHLQKGKNNNFLMLYLLVLNYSYILPVRARPLKRIRYNHYFFTFSSETRQVWFLVPPLQLHPHCSSSGLFLGVYITTSLSLQL